MIHIIDRPLLPANWQAQPLTTPLWQIVLTARQILRNQQEHREWNA